jgi:hypothetical protein
MESQSTHDTTQRATQILDAKYSKADLQSVVRDNCRHLSADQQKKLLQLLKKYESVFDGTLGDWKTFNYRRVCLQITAKLFQYQRYTTIPLSKR